MKHSIRNKSYEIERAMRELKDEEKSVPEYRWDDEIGYQPIDADSEDYPDSVVDYFNVYGRDF